MPSETLKSALAVIPLMELDTADKDKSAYLGYRFCGFPVHEALDLVGVQVRTLQRWRRDPKFLTIEAAATGPERRELRAEILQLTWMRNFAMVLRRDRELLRRALGLERGDRGEVVQLSKADQEYLKVMRGQYTPAQMQSVLALMGSDREAGNYESVIMSLVESAESVERRVEIRRPHMTVHEGEEGPDMTANDYLAAIGAAYKVEDVDAEALDTSEGQESESETEPVTQSAEGERAESGSAKGEEL